MSQWCFMRWTLTIADIAELQLAAVSATRRTFAGASVNAEVMSRLAEEGFDRSTERPPRAIQQLIENLLAEAMLAGAFAPGDTTRWR